MSAEKYAQFIAEQQKALSVSGTNPVDLNESKDENDDGWYAHKEMHGKDAVSKEDWKKGIRKPVKKPVKEDADLEESKDATKEVSKMLAAKGKTLVRNKTGLAVLRNVKKKPVKEEAEQIDEISKKLTDRYKDLAGDSLGQHADERAAQKMDKDRGYGKDRVAATKRVIKNRVKGIKLADRKETGKARVNATEEIEISLEESTYLEEMIGKGKLPDILKYHKDNLMHHQRMKQHHIAMADKSEEMGDHSSWDHHISLAQQHDMDATHHAVRVDHATSLSTKAKAHKELNAAKEKMKSANKALMAAKANKEDWG